jgi:hypothetical protein
MKKAFVFALLLAALACTSQTPQNKASLDGRTFKIENYTNGQLEGTEMMMFENGRVTNDECVKWGFGDAAYTLDDKGNFKFTLTSEKEGKMDWEGSVIETVVSGKMVWIKAGQDDIHYTFKGEEVKKN